jgi:hypothetical protein
MVTFAPEEAQQKAPEYWYLPRPITGVEADTSKEKLLKGAGEALTGGVQVAENFVEQSIRQETVQGLDNINQQAIERLNAAKANPSLIEHEANELPSAVKGLPKDLDQLDQARAHGKLSQTYVDMQKYQLAQSLRTRYAGHREFIDDTFAKSNREDPANRVVGSLMGDINSMAAAAGAKKMESRSLAIDAIKRGFPQADVMTNALFAGKMKDDAFRSWYFERSSKEAAEKHEDIENKRIEVQGKLATQRGEEIMTQRLNDRAVDFFYNHQKATPGIQTPSEIAEYHRKVSSGEVQPSDEAAQKQTQQIEQAKIQFLIEANNEMDKHAPGELSYRSIVGDEKAKKIVENSAERFTQLGKMFTDEKSGLGHLALDITKSQTSDTRYNLFNPPAGSSDADAASRYLRVMSAITRDTSPETQNILFKNILASKNLDQVLKKAITGQNAAAVVQPDGPTKPTTAKATIDELANNKAVQRLPKEQKAEAFNLAFGNIDILTSSKANITDKRNVATQFFDPNNRGVLGHFDDASQLVLWDRLTNYKVAAEMHKLGGKYYENYSGWVKDTFGTQLFPEAIQTMNKFGDVSNIKVAWDNQDHQFNIRSSSTIVKVGGVGGGALPDPELRLVQDAVINLNKGISSISGLSKYEGIDTNAYILKMLMDSGVKQGLVSELIKAVVSSGKVPNAGP